MRTPPHRRRPADLLQLQSRVQVPSLRLRVVRIDNIRGLTLFIITHRDSAQDKEDEGESPVAPRPKSAAADEQEEDGDDDGDDDDNENQKWLTSLGLQPGTGRRVGRARATSKTWSLSLSLFQSLWRRVSIYEYQYTNNDRQLATLIIFMGTHCGSRCRLQCRRVVHVTKLGMDSEESL